MQIYIIIYVFNTILSYLNSKIDTKKLLAISFTVLNIFLCFNYLNGIDWTHYQITFINTPNLLEIGDVDSLKGVKGNEFLFVYLIALFKLIPNLNYEIFQYILLTIDLLIIYWFLNKYSENPLLIITLSISFLTYMMFEPILRQLQAFVIFLYAIESIKKRKLFRYFFLIIIATMFHSSAIILLPLYFIYVMDLNIKKINLILILTVILVFISDFLVNILFKISFLSHYAGYLKSDKYGVQSFNLLVLIKIFLKDFVIINLVCYLKNKNKIIIRNYRIVLIGYIFFIIMKLLNLKIGIMFRFNNFFLIFSVIYLSYLVIVFKNKRLQRFINLFIVIYMFVGYIKYIEKNKTEQYRLVPYSNYLKEYNRFSNEFIKIKFRLNH